MNHQVFQKTAGYSSQMKLMLVTLETQAEANVNLPWIAKTTI